MATTPERKKRDAAVRILGAALSAVSLARLLIGTAAAATLAVPAGYPTIQSALDAAAPGDTVEVAAGTYFEKLVFASGGSAAAGYLSLQAAAGARPVIDGSGVAGNNMILIDSKSYVRVSGFELRNNLGVRDGSGIRVIGAGGHIELLDNVIHEMRGSNAMGITVYGTEAMPIDNLRIGGNEIFDCDAARSEALTLNGNVSNFEISDNLVRDVNNIGIDMIGGETDIQPNKALVARNGVVRGNTVLRANSSYGGGFAAGIYVDGGRDIVIENNLVRQCDLGIEIGAENSGLVASGIVVRNNVLADNLKAGLAFGGYAASAGRADGNTFSGNTLVGNNTVGRTAGGEAEIWVQYASDNEVRSNLVVAGADGVFLSSFKGWSANHFDYNLYFYAGDPAAAGFSLNDVWYSGLADWRTGSGQDAASLFADPLLADLAGGDFHIAGNSPAIDAGDPAFVAAPGEVDLDGAPRLIGAAVDIGADEASCGNGAIESGEECDDGNQTSGDGCDANCTWTACGNGITTAGEQCDDGNVSGGDCCDASCAFEAAGAICDDGALCSRDDVCDGAGVCAGSVGIDPACLTPTLPRGSVLKMRRSSDGRKNQLLWRWSKGPDLPESFFGDPTTTTAYSVCVFADRAGVPSVVAAVSAQSGPPWEARKGRPGAFRYRDTKGSAGGLRSMELRPGASKKLRVKVKAKGLRLGLGELGFGAPATVAVQLSGAAGGCLAAAFADPFLRDDSLRFRDRSD